MGTGGPKKGSTLLARLPGSTFSAGDSFSSSSSPASLISPASPTSSSSKTFKRTRSLHKGTISRQKRRDETRTPPPIEVPSWGGNLEASPSQEGKKKGPSSRPPLASSRSPPTEPVTPPQEFPHSARPRLSTMLAGKKEGGSMLKGRKRRLTATTPPKAFGEEKKGGLVRNQTGDLVVKPSKSTTPPPPLSLSDMGDGGYKEGEGGSKIEFSSLRTDSGSRIEFTISDHSSFSSSSNSLQPGPTLTPREDDGGGSVVVRRNSFSPRGKITLQKDKKKSSPNHSPNPSPSPSPNPSPNLFASSQPPSSPLLSPPSTPHSPGGGGWTCLAFLPTHVGKHKIEVIYNGHTVHSFPLSVNNLVVEFGGLKEEGLVVGEESSVEVRFYNEKTGARFFFSFLLSFFHPLI